MRPTHSLFVAAVLVPLGVTLQAAKPPVFSPVKENGELVLFDAATHDLAVIRNYTHGNQKGHDAVPVVAPVVKGGQKMAEFTYRGQQGTACSTFWFENVPAPEDGMRYAGLSFTIDYDKDDFAKVEAQAHFADGSGLTAPLTLEPGCKDYVFRTGFRRAKAPIRWDTLCYFWLAADAHGQGNPLKFRLKRVVMCQEPGSKRARTLAVGKVRKVHEVLPVQGALALDGRLDDPAWRSAGELASLYVFGGREVPAGDSPFRVRLAYDRARLYIATQAQFPTEPVAKETRPDGSVYGDEAQEFLFSGPQDNRQHVQFVFNAKGVIFDAATEYDLEAAGIRTKIDKTITHEKAWRHENGLWTAELAFPLAELQVDLDKQRSMGFQVAQSYIAREDKRLRTMVWDRTTEFPRVPDFGVLVLNRAAFGPGTATVTGIERLDKPDGTAEFRFACSFEGFQAGSYAADWKLVGASAEAGRETWTLGVGPISRTLAVTGAENRTGLHTFLLTLRNGPGDARVCAVNFTNETDAPDLFGQRLFNPRLKRVQWRAGAFLAREHTRLFLDPRATARTRRTAELFVADYLAHTGVRLQTVPLPGADPAAGIVLRVATAARHDGQPAAPKKDGYCLAVEKDRVLVTGFDEPGLYYGLVTFFQLMKNSMRIEDRMPVPCCEVYDWPDLPFRMVSAQGTSGFKNQTPKDNFGIAYMMEWVDRFVAGQKANVFYWDLSSRVKYQRRPEFNGSERMYSLEDLKRFGEFCRDRFVEVCPAWQCGGHADWWLLGYHPELREKGYSHQADVTHPEHNKIVFDCMLDVAEALECKYLSPKGDEWWGPRQANESPDELLNGQTRAQAFLDFHVALNNWLKPCGITMLLYHDMLTPYHNGKKYDLYTIADRFPKDVIIQYWGGYDIEKGLAFFAERGFSIWLHSTGPMLQVGEKQKPLVQGAGKILYSLGNDKTGGLLDEQSDFNDLYASHRMLDYAWNLFDYKPPEEGRPVTLKNILAVKPNPCAAARVEPLEIGGALTQSFHAFLKAAKPKDYGEVDAPVALPRGVQEVGFLPMRFSENDSGNCLVLRKGAEPVSIPVAGAYSSLIFLHTAFIDDPKDKGAAGGMSRYWLYGWPCGEYVVHYEDGETVKLPVRLTMNIRRFDTSSKNRATNENRCVLALKDVNQTNVHLFQWEWVNPHPEKKIAKVEARHDKHLDVSLILFAVSGRGVWTPGGF